MAAESLRLEAALVVLAAGFFGAAFLVTTFLTLAELAVALMARAAAAAARRVVRAGSCDCVDDAILVDGALAATLVFDPRAPVAAALRAAAFLSAKAACRSFKFAINLRYCSFSCAGVGRGLEGSRRNWKGLVRAIEDGARGGADAVQCATNAIECIVALQ